MTTKFAITAAMSPCHNTVMVVRKAASHTRTCRADETT